MKLQKSCFFILIGLFLLPTSNVLSAVSATNEPVATASEVIVIYNSDYLTDSNSDTVQDSLEIANYYKNKRSIPNGNVIGVSAPLTEVITRSEFNTLKTTIESAITSAGLEDTTKYVVLTKGMPLKVYPTSGSTANSNGDYASVDSALTLLYQDTNSGGGKNVNPYYNDDIYSLHDESLAITELLKYRFKENTFSLGSGEYLKFLVTRLDGFTVADVETMIDRAYDADTTGTGYFVLDAYDTLGVGDSTQNASRNLEFLGKNFYPDPYSVGITPITTINENVMGYVSHGKYSNLAANFYETVLDFNYLNGAIAMTYESFSNYTYTEDNSVSSPYEGHGQISNFIQAGGSGGIGSVYEPYAAFMPEEAVWATAYSAGYSWADAAYMSMPYIDWTFVVVGDPLMRIVPSGIDAPTVTTSSASSVDAQTATLNGNITATGGENATERGFEYGTSTSYGTEVSSTGSFSTGAYTGSASGLTCNTTYHYRAYSRNSIHRGYGSDQTFTTSACSGPDVVTSSASSVESLSATLNGYISENGQGTSSTVGFEYGLTTSYGTTTSTAGTFGQGANFSTKFGSSGTGNGQFDAPTGITIDTSGNIYVVDANNSRVQKFDSAGNYLSSFGSYGTGNGEFDFPEDMAIDSSGNIYVVDTYNARIQKFNSSGVYQSQWGSYGSGNGQFRDPTGIAIDGSDNIYVVEYYGRRVQKFDTNGTYVTKWGSSGSTDGRFLYPYGIATDSDGYVYVADTDNTRIQKFTSTGTYVSQWTTDGYPYGIFIDGDDNIYVAQDPIVQKFDSSGNVLTEFGSSGSNDGQFDYAADIALDSNEDIWVADINNNRVQKFESAGDIENVFSQSITGLTCNTTYHYRAYATNTGGIGYGSDGTFTTDPSCPPTIVTTSASVLSQASATLVGDVTDGGDEPVTIRGFQYGLTTSYGSTTTETGNFSSDLGYLIKFGSSGSGNGAFNLPRAVAIDSSGNIYVADRLNHRIQKFDSSGNYVTKWGSFGTSNGQFKYPRGLAIDPTNTYLYVADSDNFRVQKFDLSGNYVTKWGSYGSSNGNLSYPQDIVVDSSGYVYVSDYDNKRITKFNDTGTYVTKWGSSGTGNSQFNVPYDLGIDSSGNIYVADNLNNRIQKFDSSGNYLTQWGSSGTGNGQFNVPSGVVVDSDDYVYVSDSGNNRIQKFDSSGNFITEFGQGGSDNAEFNSPQGLAVDTDDNIYVADYSNHRIQKFFGEDSEFTTLISGLGCGEYNYRSYATNSIGTSYGSNKIFNTNGCGSVPVEILQAMSDNLRQNQKLVSPISQSIPLKNQEDVVKIKEDKILFNKNLSLGMRSDDVKVLQQFLNANDYTVAKSGPGSKGFETNYFGPATKKAVIAFQKSNKISTTGTVGPLTRNAIAKTKTEKIPCTSQIAVAKKDSTSCPI